MQYIKHFNLVIVVLNRKETSQNGKMGRISIWENDVDFAVNFALIKALNVMPNVLEMIEKLENHKSGIIA